MIYEISSTELVNRSFHFQKCCQDFIGTYDETVSVVMRVHNPNRGDATPERGQLRHSQSLRGLGRESLRLRLPPTACRVHIPRGRPRHNGPSCPALQAATEFEAPTLHREMT